MSMSIFIQLKSQFVINHFNRLFFLTSTSGLFFFFWDKSKQLDWPIKEFLLFLNLFFNFGTSQGTFKYCWMSGVRGDLKYWDTGDFLLLGSLSTWELKFKLRLKFSFWVFPLSPKVLFFKLARSDLLWLELLEGVLPLVCSWDLSEIGDKIWSLLMKRDSFLRDVWDCLWSRDWDEVRMSLVLWLWLLLLQQLSPRRRFMVKIIQSLKFSANSHEIYQFP